MVGILGLIAGDGRFPHEIARAARGHGRRVHAVGFHDLTTASLADEVDALCWLELGQLDALLDSLQSAGVRDAVLAGKVSKRHLFDSSHRLLPDARALALLAGLPDRSDGAILAALADWLESEGIVLRPQCELVPELVPGPGPLGAFAPTPRQLADVAVAWPIARVLASCEVGQCVVVRDGAVLAVEAIEGTDAAIERGGRLGGPGACVVKVARPRQDPRFDLPAIGPDTLASLLAVGAGVLAFEAGSTLVLERERLVKEADAAGVAIYGVPAGGPA